MNHTLNRVISSDKLLAVSIEDAAKQCRLTSDELDDSIRNELEHCILAAQSFLSEKYNIIFGKSECEAIYHIGNFNVRKLYIPIFPCVSIKTVEQNNELSQSWNLYKGSYTSFIEFESSLAFNKKIRVNYICGFEFNDEIPMNIKQSILMLVAHYFDNKNPTTNQSSYNLGYAIDALMTPYNKLRIV